LHLSFLVSHHLSHYLAFLPFPFFSFSLSFSVLSNPLSPLLSPFVSKVKRCRCDQFVGAKSGANTAFSCCLLTVFFPRIYSLQTTRSGTASERCTAWMTSCNSYTT
jgi:hypothetical protein